LLGAAAPLAYITCAVLMGLIVLCIAQAGSRVSLTGGPYAYVEVTLGRYVGFLVGVLLWLIGATAIPGVATLFADAAGKLMPVFSGWTGRAVFLAVMFAIVSGVNILGVRQGTRLNTVFTVAKLVPLVLLLGAGLFAVHGENLRWTNGIPAATDVSRASIVLIFIFAGVESALVPSGEVRDTARTVPRALMIAMLTITLLYIGLQVVAQGVLGTALVGDSTPLASAAAKVFGPWGSTMISVGLMISAFGYLSGMMLAAPRALFAFARDGMLPRVLARVHPTRHTPWVAIVVQGVIAWALAVSNQFESLVIIANISALLIYLGCAIAAARIQQQDSRQQKVDGEPRNVGGFRVPGGYVVPVLTVMALLFLLSSATLKEWTVLVAVLAISSVVYAIAGQRSRSALVSGIGEGSTTP
jgi:amino acid transporter